MQNKQMSNHDVWVSPQAKDLEQHASARQNPNLKSFEATERCQGSPKLRMPWGLDLVKIARADNQSAATKSLFTGAAEVFGSVFVVKNK